MLHNQLDTCSAVEFIGVQPISQTGAARECGIVAELDGGVIPAVSFELQTQVLFFQDALVDNGESSQKTGTGKPCPQTCVSSRPMKSRVKQSSSSEPSVSMILSSCVWVNHSFATFSNAWVNTSKPSGCNVRPAAMAWPPNWTIRPGCRFATRSSASRR